LKVDRSKVTVMTDENEIVVKVEPPQKEEVIAPPTPVVPVGAEGAVPAEGEVPTEGGAPAEGQPATEAPKEEPKKYSTPSLGQSFLSLQYFPFP
jgi:hypothetical protein